MLYAVQLQADASNTTVSPGPMAMSTMGFAGILLVLVSGWTTANPIIYRSGLAFQGINSKWSRYRITLAICLFLNLFSGIQVFFLGLPGWFIAVAIYIVFSLYYQGRLKLQTG